MNRKGCLLLVTAFIDPIALYFSPTLINTMKISISDSVHHLENGVILKGEVEKGEIAYYEF